MRLESLERRTLFGVGITWCLLLMALGTFTEGPSVPLEDDAAMTKAARATGVFYQEQIVRAHRTGEFFTPEDLASGEVVRQDVQGTTLVAFEGTATAFLVVLAEEEGATCSLAVKIDQDDHSRPQRRCWDGIPPDQLQLPNAPGGADAG